MTRSIEFVDMSNFESRKGEIADRLWNVATNVGFFYLVNHGISNEEVSRMFEYSKRYFDMPQSIKEKNQYDIKTNNGWEGGTEVLDEALPDYKETYNVGFVKMNGMFPTEQDLPGFTAQAKEFMSKVERLSFQVLSCFALKLGFPEDFFNQHHDASKEDCTKIMRLLFYPSIEGKEIPQGQWRAGQHTDYGCITLLFQRGEKGLQVCPGREVDGAWETGSKVTNTLTWTEVEPVEGSIVVNIGDSLMRWSDDRLRSNLHRVRFPLPDEPKGPRYSIAFFNQPNKSSIIEGPLKKYPAISAGDYLEERFSKTYTKEAGGSIDSKL